MYLNCKTYYSFRYGTFSTEELVNKALEEGISEMSALALTNINSTCDAWEFVKLCWEKQIKPILGVEVRNEDKLLYILIAANNKGFAWINRFLSEHLINKTAFPEPNENPLLFENYTDGFVIYPLFAKDLSLLNSNEKIGLLPTEVNKLFSIHWKEHKEKFVVRHPVTFQNKTYYNLHRLLRAIDKNCLLSKLPKETEASPNEIFVSPQYIFNAFKEYPFIITNTYRLMDACCIEMDFDVDKNMQCYSATDRKRTRLNSSHANISY